RDRAGGKIGPPAAALPGLRCTPNHLSRSRRRNARRAVLAARAVVVRARRCGSGRADDPAISVLKPARCRRTNKGRTHDTCIASAAAAGRSGTRVCPAVGADRRYGIAVGLSRAESAVSRPLSRPVLPVLPACDRAYGG